MNGNVIESANFFVLIIACYVGWRTTKWTRRTDVDPFTRWVICCWMFVFAGIGFNRGWFAMSRFLHTDDDYWHAFMFEFRWLVVVITSGLVGWGAVSFTMMIDEASDLKKWVVFVASAVAAIGLGFY